MAELEFRELSVRVGGRTLLDHITLRVEAGEFVALVGQNGAGKTTLLKTALALRAPSTGSVLVGERDVRTLPARARAAGIGWLPQRIHADEPVTALATVAAARFRFEESHAASQRAAADALERVAGSPYAERPITQLSGGERQRVALAALIAQDPRTMLFDEPANHLDPAQQLDVYRTLGELWRDGRTLLCITHDVNLLHQVGNAERLRVIGLSAGRVAFDASFTDPELPRHLSTLFGIQMTSVSSLGQRFVLPRSQSTP
jgi:iron complex transport system ATP-binding protein